MAMVFLVSVDVSLRKTIGSFIGAIELTEFLMVAVVFLALAYVQAEKRHLRMVMLIDRIGHPKNRAIVEIIACLLALVIYGLIFWYVLEATREDYVCGDYINEGAPRLTMTWPARAFIPLGSLLYCAQLIVDMIDNLKVLTSKAGQ